MLIGEVARRCGVSGRMLRHYDALGLVRPTGRTTGGYREYSPEDLRRLFHVESLRTLGLSLRQIAEALDDPGATPATVLEDLVRHTEERLAQVQELLERLRAIRTSTTTDWQDVLRVVELMQGLDSGSAARRQQAALSSSLETPAPGRLVADAVLTEADPHVSGALRWALARSSGDGVPALALAAHSEDVDTRRRAIHALVEVPEVPAVTSALTEALDDADSVVRGLAALALGGRGSAAAVPVLVDMVADGVHDVDAAEALGTVARAQDTLDRIVADLALRAESPAADRATRIRVAQALFELGGPAAHRSLTALAHADDRVVALVSAALLDPPRG